MGVHKERSKPEPKVTSEPSQKEADLEALTIEVASLRKALSDEKERSADYLNRLKYMQAELENLQKKTNKEIDEIVERADEKLISKLLVVVDEMEMAMKASSKVENCKAVRSGFELILEKLREILKNEGLIRIEAVGKQFDPSFHEAADQTHREDAPEGSIVEELRPGYMIKGRLLRPSVVVVAKNPTEQPSEETVGKTV